MMARDGSGKHRAQKMSTQKRTMGAAGNRNEWTTTPKVLRGWSRTTAVAQRSRSVVERCWLPISIGHCAYKSRSGANSSVVRMRKLEALLGFADYGLRRFLDAFGLQLLPGRLRRGRPH